MTYFRLLWLLVAFFSFDVVASQPPQNIKRRERDVRKLIKKAVSYLSNHSIGQACHEFTHNPAWRKGELFVFILGENECYAFGDEKDRIWTSFADYKDVMGVPLITRLLKAQDRGASIVINNSTMHVHVKRIIKDGKGYLVGSGFYPESAEYIVVDLVHRALQLIHEIGLESAATQISNPHGFLVKGDSYVFVIGEDGVIFAQGEDRPRIGVNIFSAADISQPMLNKNEFKKFFQSNVKEGWLAPINYGGTINRIYAAKYVDPKTKKTYLVGSVYYPDINDDSVFALVQKAIAHIKAQGRAAAFAEFNRPHGQFSIGGMRIIVYSLDGVVLANGEDPDEVGYNVYERLNERGHPMVKRLIDAAKRETRAWVNQWDRNAYKFIYSEKVDLPEGTIIVTSGYWPESKPLTVKSMVERATDFMQRKGKVEALQQFTGDDSDFLRGDVFVSVIDTDGIVLSQGPFLKHGIWDDLRIRDVHGKKVVSSLLDTANQGGGWVTFKANNAKYNAYSKLVEMLSPTGETESLVVVSGYYP
jgi:cytochrome c